MAQWRDITESLTEPRCDAQTVAKLAEIPSVVIKELHDADAPARAAARAGNSPQRSKAMSNIIETVNSTLQSLEALLPEADLFDQWTVNKPALLAS